MRVSFPIRYMTVQPAEDNAFNRFALSLIKDPRDLIFVKYTALMLVTVVPYAAFLFVPGVFRAWMAPIYLASLIYFCVDRYILMLHATSHRPLFKKEYSFLNHVIPWVLGPFFGQTPGTYFVHHIGMHHPENNLLPDLSSTMWYQRDRFTHFLHYWATFFFFGPPTLIAYLVRNKRWALLRKMVLGEVSWYIVVACLLYLAPGPTMAVFVMPFLILRWAMMAGNWAQHAFVCSEQPENPYRNSVTLINARHNLRCYNDGYHVIHHEKQAMHWSEMPLHFDQNWQKFGEERAVVFDGLQGYQHVWLLLMLNRYDKLADRFVECGEPMSKDEIIAFLKKRTAYFPVRAEETQAAAAK
jgi:hypothetical protein